MCAECTRRGFTARNGQCYQCTDTCQQGLPKSAFSEFLLLSSLGSADFMYARRGGAWNPSLRFRHSSRVRITSLATLHCASNVHVNLSSNWGDYDGPEMQG
ncbi:unnamed protein product [Prorocentrum cordatum]|uniref:Beta-galactosidase n=1 Tax=Prorocentrum cordatum TaxID=2364126 RepID=A0ABN9XHB9_9DINO|nr:unnamed protein product [Polarella glacialis]